MKSTPTKILASFSLFLLLTAFSVPALAGPRGFGGFGDRDEELVKLQEEVGAHLLFIELGLSADQKASMRQQLTQIRATLDKIDALRAKVHEKHKQHMQAALAKLKKGQVPAMTDLNIDQQEMENLHEQMRTLWETLGDQFDTLLGGLTVDQMTKLRDFHPMALMGMGPIRDFGCSGDAKTVLDQIRYAPQPFIDRLEARMQRHSQRPGMAANADMGKALDDFMAIVKQVRELSEDDYRAKRDALAAGLDDNFIKTLQALCDRRGKRGHRGKNRGMGMGPGQGRGMGPGQGMGQGQGMGMPDDMMGPGPNWGSGRKGHQMMIRHLLVSDTFYELLAK